MKQKQLLVVFLSALCSIGVFAVVASFLIAIQRNSNENVYYHKPDEGWVIYVNGKKSENVDLSTFEFDERIKAGDTIILSNTLPKDLVEQASMRFLIYLSSVDVFVDNHLVYSYGNIEALRGKFVGSGYHFVRIPDDSAGKGIRIVIHANEDGAFTNVPEIVYISTKYLYPNFFQNNIISIFCGIFLFILGFVLTVSSFIAALYKSAFRGLMHIGFFSLFIGFWSLCNTKMMQVFSLDFGINTSLEYFVLYAALPSIIGLLLFMRSSTISRWKRYSLFAIYGLSMAYFVVTAFLHFANVVHYPKTLTVFHCLALFCMVIIIIAGHKPFKLLSLSEKIMNIDMVVISMFGVLDVVRYNIQKYFFPGLTILAHSVLPAGTAFFIVILLISYLVFLYDEALGISEKELLSKMAYRDQLTRLYNRAESDLLFKECDSNKEINYAIVNLDLNGLKRTNDTFGHEAGDKLIQKFAEILDNCFGKMGYVIRMGGDEFIVIIKEPEAKMIEYAIDQMEEQEHKASQGVPYSIDAAYGVAYSSELHNPIAERVYAMADERMYSMKEASKRGRL